jgi:hypothetical protein
MMNLHSNDIVAPSTPVTARPITSWQPGPFVWKYGQTGSEFARSAGFLKRRWAHEDSIGTATKNPRFVGRRETRGSCGDKKGDAGDAYDSITPSPCCAVSLTFLHSLLARLNVYTHNANTISENGPAVKRILGHLHLGEKPSHAPKEPQARGRLSLPRRPSCPSIGRGGVHSACGRHRQRRGAAASWHPQSQGRCSSWRPSSPHHGLR